MNILARIRHWEGRRRSSWIEGDWTLSFPDLLDRSRRLGHFLGSFGLEAGDVIAAGIRDDAEVSIVFLACLQAGLVPIFVDPDSTAAEVAYLLGKTEVMLLLAEEDLLARWVGSSCSIPTCRVVARKKSLLSRWKKSSADEADTYPAVLSGLPASPLEHTPGASDLALLLYTSGTTGGPKLVPWTRAGLAAQAETMEKALGHDEQARVLNLMPITHVDGLLTGILTTLWSGGTMIRLQPFSLPRLPLFLDAVYKHRVTQMITVPTLLSLMLQDEERLKEAMATEDFTGVVSTASTLSPELWERFERVSGRPVANMYGMSEIGNLIFAGPDDASREIGSIGLPVDCEVRVLGDDDRPVSRGESGELVVAGVSVTPGYLGQETPFLEQDGTRWFRTGDLVTEGEEGHLRLVGRKKDLIITGGRNVAPDEVNQALLSHPAVVEAATFSVEDEIWGERIVSCIVSSESASESDVLEHVSARLAPFKVPRVLHRLTALPKGRSGKVLIDELKKRLESAGPDEANGGVDVEGIVLDLAAKAFRTPRASLTLTSGPETCSGWDSMAHLDFVCRIERALAVAFGPKDIMRMQSLAVVVDLVRQRQSEA